MPSHTRTIYQIWFSESRAEEVESDDEVITVFVPQGKSTWRCVQSCKYWDKKCETCVSLLKEISGQASHVFLWNDLKIKDRAG